MITILHFLTIKEKNIVIHRVVHASQRKTEVNMIMLTIKFINELAPPPQIKKEIVKKKVHPLFLILFKMSACYAIALQSHYQL